MFQNLSIKARLFEELDASARTLKEGAQNLLSSVGEFKLHEQLAPTGRTAQRLPGLRAY